MRIYVILVILICVGALSTMAQKPKKSKTKRLKLKGSDPRPEKQPPVAIMPSSEVKVAEELVNIAQRLLRMLKYGSGSGSANVAHLCPNGKLEAICPAEPCKMFKCSNIVDAVCENQCHTCDPLFKIDKNNVTEFCKVVPVSLGVPNKMPMNTGPDPGMTGGPIQSMGQTDPFQMFPFHPFQMLPTAPTEAQQEGMNAFSRMFHPFEGASRAEVGGSTRADTASATNTKNQQRTERTKKRRSRRRRNKNKP